MSNIDKIRQEIERRLQRENEILWNAKKRGTYPSSSCEYNLLTLTSLRDFINSLPEEKPSEDLEEAADRYASDSTGFIDMTAYRAFIAGAEWMKEQMMKDAKEIITVQGSLTEPEFVKQRVIFLKEG